MASRTKKQKRKEPRRRNPRRPRPSKDPSLCEVEDCAEPRFSDFNVCLGHLIELEGPELASGAAAGRGLDQDAVELLEALALVFAPAAGRLANQYAAQLRGEAPPPRPPPPRPPHRPSALEQLELLGFRPTRRPPPKSEVEAFRRHMARVYHADAGGTCIDPDMMGRINAACDEVLR